MQSRGHDRGCSSEQIRTIDRMRAIAAGTETGGARAQRPSRAHTLSSAAEQDPGVRPTGPLPYCGPADTLRRRLPRRPRRDRPSNATQTLNPRTAC